MNKMDEYFKEVDDFFDFYIEDVNTSSLIIQQDLEYYVSLGVDKIKVYLEKERDNMNRITQDYEKFDRSIISDYQHTLERFSKFTDTPYNHPRVVGKQEAYNTCIRNLEAKTNAYKESLKRYESVINHLRERYITYLTFSPFQLPNIDL